MIDDVRLTVLGRAPVVASGGISTDRDGFGIGAFFAPEQVRARIESVLAARSAA